MAEKRRSNKSLDVVQAKKISLKIAESKSTETLLSLSDECLFTIFDFLTLSDLCVMSKLCKRLQTLAKIEFESKYSLKWAHITIRTPVNQPEIQLRKLSVTTDEYNSVAKTGISRYALCFAETRLHQMFTVDVAEFAQWEKKLSPKDKLFCRLLITLHAFTKILGAS